MLSEIGFYTYLVSAGAYLFLTTLLIISWRGKLLATIIVAASAASALWAAAIAASHYLSDFPIFLLKIAELLRTGGWCLLLFKLAEPKGDSGFLRNFPLLAGIVLLTPLLLFGLPLLADFVRVPTGLVRDMALAAWVSLAIIGLVLVEQVYRNSPSADRWTLRYLCVGLGLIFAYDFYMYADALLVKTLNPTLWVVRACVNALAVPLIAISVARNPSWDLQIHVSRHVVFHSVTLMGAGIYLILMAVSGYFIRFYGGNWGGLIQALFLLLTGAMLVVLLFSDRIRAQIRVLLSKHFFSYKYDYREEWTRFTDNLSSGDSPVPQRVIFALAKLVHSNSGVLWLRREDEFELLECWNMEKPRAVSIEELNNVAEFMESQQWVVDLSEFRDQPGLYPDLELSDSLLHIENSWLLIPLFYGGRVFGLVLLGKPEVIHTINWEDHDLLKVAGRQAASELAQYQLNRELVQARQFEAFNRLSAYVVHDLKNILAQQSLIVSNAEKHKSNPAFVDDVIGTVRNSVARMTRLMEQMRSGIRSEPVEDIDIQSLLQDVVQRHARRRPHPELRTNGETFTVPADREQLATVFGHIIENAQDACGKSGSVVVSLARSEGDRAIIEVEDNGSGMDQDFIQTRLFTPFDSTKGLTGMGVGAFESREYVRSLGGDIDVSSTPGMGSTFRIVIPCQPHQSREAM